MASAARPPIIAGDSCASPFSPLSPAAGVGDGWDTPASAKNAPLPSKAHLLPDRPPSPVRNHHRSTSPHLKLSSLGAAPPPPRSKPKLATPSHGYPFPWVLSRTATPLSAAGLPASPTRSDASTPPTEQPFLSSAFSSDGSSAASSACPTPNDDQPLPASKPSTPAIHPKPETPFEIAQARTKNAGSTPGAPPPARLVEGAGQSHDSQDFKDVQRMLSSREESGAEEGDGQTAATKARNPLVDGLRGLTVDGPKGAGRKRGLD
ncbi:hypothetical protein JCM1841_000323 [Sporobolomyces salmonicolor]